jgi:hypothetical protein
MGKEFWGEVAVLGAAFAVGLAFIFLCAGLVFGFGELTGSIPND